MVLLDCSTSFPLPALASVAETPGRLATDCCMYASRNFGFIRLPDTMTTGSSIMPHKKDPDVDDIKAISMTKLNGLL
ncbi:MAG: hypothetical protein IJS66_04630 [Bacteroidales bacterium]|nr:hypothetical protein [Bacteroidales bacterium]